MIELFDIAQHYLLPFIVVISIVVFVHEYGHYWVARRCGVRIMTFSLGFGREIFGWDDRHGTHWKVSWLPFGGYVKMFGDADPASNPDETVHAMTEEEKKVSFFHQPIGRRMAIVVAGPATNYLFAILVLALLFVFKGQPYTPADIAEVSANGAAAVAGLQPGDHIAVIDGKAIERFEDVKRIAALNQGTPLAFEVDRNGKRVHMTVTPEVVVTTDRFGDEEKVGRIGISSNALAYVKRTPIEAVQQAFKETWSLTSLTLQAMGQIVKGTRSSDELRGALGIAEMSGKVAKDGITSLIWFIGIFSINLGLINLFPVPLLDGGHLAFYTIEWLRGRPLSENAREASSRVGLVLIVSLMVFGTWNDLVHLKVVSYVRNLFS